jgi:hypothetical protein
MSETLRVPSICLGPRQKRPHHLVLTEGESREEVDVLDQFVNCEDMKSE